MTDTHTDGLTNNSHSPTNSPVTVPSIHPVTQMVMWSCCRTDLCLNDAVPNTRGSKKNSSTAPTLFFILKPKPGMTAKIHFHMAMSTALDTTRLVAAAHRVLCTHGTLRLASFMPHSSSKHTSHSRYHTAHTTQHTVHHTQITQSTPHIIQHTSHTANLTPCTHSVYRQCRRIKLTTKFGH